MSAVASVTLHRVAVTMPEAPADAPSSTDQAARILAEIAERLDEIDECKVGLAADTIIRLAGIAQRSRRAFSVVVQLMHGRTDDVLSSYQEQADARHVTKQDVHYEFLHAVEAIRPAYPQLAATLLGMRAQALQHEDPISGHEVAHGGRDGE